MRQRRGLVSNVPRLFVIDGLCLWSILYIKGMRGGLGIFVLDRKLENGLTS